MGITLLLAGAGTAFEAFCNGAILAAVVFLTAKGIRTPVKNKKK